MTTRASNQFVLLNHLVEPLKKNANESDRDAMERTLLDRALKGWQIVEACGDEVRSPILIFRKLNDASSILEYKVEEISHARDQNEIQFVTDRLWQRKEQGWLPACILDSPFTPPLAVYVHSSQPLNDVQIKLVEVSTELFEKSGDAIVHELLDQQLRNSLTLTSIMHGGLNPVLILTSQDPGVSYEYHVAYPGAVVLSDQTAKLAGLIEEQIQEGWQVCGAFEESMLFACLVFRRSLDGSK